MSKMRVRLIYLLLKFARSLQAYDRAWATKPHAALKGGGTTICPNTTAPGFGVAAVHEHKGTLTGIRYQVLNSGTIALAPARNGS